MAQYYQLLWFNWVDSFIMLHCKRDTNLNLSAFYGIMTTAENIAPIWVLTISIWATDLVSYRILCCFLSPRIKGMDFSNDNVFIRSTFMFGAYFTESLPNLQRNFLYKRKMNSIESILLMSRSEVWFRRLCAISWIIVLHLEATLLWFCIYFGFVFTILYLCWTMIDFTTQIQIFCRILLKIKETF